ncbi:hypothetical protein [Umezawaea beigongshangensis]|uniref:hypothetical protein n=1 Tax=Umezawaea beigongshangensis TaxID=2780383 RepID=UPI0018F1CE3F|nr:hypothetical protein [Umezawaea beigongshangensis]
MSRVAVVAALAVGLCALTGCGGDERPGAAGASPTSTTPSASSASSGASATAGTSAPADPSAREPGSTAGSQAPRPPASGAPPVEVPPDAKDVPRERVDTGALPDGAVQRVVTARDDRSVTVVATTGACDDATSELTAESAQVVQVTLVTWSTLPADGVCTAQAVERSFTQQLAAPLGDRRLVVEMREE